MNASSVPNGIRSPQPKEQPDASTMGGEGRMKLLLSLIETAEAASSTESLVAVVTAASKAHGSSGAATLQMNQSVKASQVLIDTRRNTVTPTPATQAQVWTPSLEIKPLARPPTLVSAAMFLTLSKREHELQGLKMPPPLAGCYSPSATLGSFNNHFPRSPPSPPTVPVGKVKPTLAVSSGMLLRHLIATSVPGESTKEASPSQLHAVCCSGNDPRPNVASIIASIVARDGMAIRRRCQIAKTKTSSRSVVVVALKNHLARPCRTYEPYGFPLNLALLHQPQDEPDLDILRLLAELGPDVLRLDDGRNGGGSLTFALRHHPKNIHIVRLLLDVNPKCIQVSDKRGNWPLHVACFHGAPLEVVQELYHHDPSAIDKANMSGETPWHIVQRNSRLSSSPVAEFLYACTKRREGRIRKLTPHMRSLYFKN
jgi:hypothetical protein